MPVKNKKPEESEKLKSALQVLTQLFAAQSILHVFPDREKMLSFASLALKNIPGVKLCSICLINKTSQIGDSFEAAVKLSNVLVGCSEESLLSSDQLLQDENIFSYTLHTVDHFYGYVLLEAMKNNFAYFDPMVNNFINMMAIHLENFEKNSEIEIYQEQLENPIKERTKELLKEIEVRKQTENKYLDLYENAPDMFVSVDPLTAKVLQCNETLVKITGFSKKEIIGKPIFDRYHPKCMDDVKRAFKKFQESGEVHNAELTLRHKNGGEINVLLNVSSVRDKKGKILYSRSSWRDISNQKRTNEKLLKNQSFIESILEYAPIGFALNTIDDGKGVYVGSKFEKIYGVDRGSIHSVDDYFEKVFIDPIYREQIRARIMGDIMSQDASRMKWDAVPITTKSGTKKIVNISNIPLFDQNYMISTVQDVTDLKRSEESISLAQAETQEMLELANKSRRALLGVAEDEKKAREELKKLNEVLEQKVAERTKDLQLKITEIERINKLFIDRELRMIELKKEIKELENKLKRKSNF